MQSNLIKKSSVVKPEEISEPWRCLAAWFLGPKAENRIEFNELALSILNGYEDYRAAYQPTDPPYITEEVRRSQAYEEEMETLERELGALNETLRQSIPFFSLRYKGHMLWDVSMPSLLGYISGMLFNQNNVDSSTSPVTTTIETTVGKQLCQMLGFSKENDVDSWGHITSCGSVANIEALWVARNLKFFPTAMRNAVVNDDRLASARETAYIYVPRLDDEVQLIDADSWDLLNLDVDDVCSMATSIAQTTGLQMKELTKILDGYTQSSLGLSKFSKDNQINEPVFLSPATNHYSWPKAATLLGLGYNSLIQVPVDTNGRQDLKELEKLLESCLQNRVPVLSLVAIIGTTEESAVDPVVEILQIREKFKKKGLNFCIHADAAWGGYLLSMIREPTGKRAEKYLRVSEPVKEDVDLPSILLRRTHSIPTKLDRGPLLIRSLEGLTQKDERRHESVRLRHKTNLDDFVPDLKLSQFVSAQFNSLKMVDTITIDPHKAGYCVYPSGALCYRNGSMRSFITLAAPEVYHGEDDPSVGVYGLEGSKPGAAATSVLLSHNVIGLDRYGYGRILGQCTFSAKLFFCMWMTIAQDGDPFVCLNFIDSKPSTFSDVKQFIRKRIHGKTNKEISEDEVAMRFLAEIGPDALINTFAVNLKNEDGSLNTDINIVNELQSDIFKELSGRVGMTTKRIPMYLTTSEFNAVKYGYALDKFKDRLGLKETNTEKRNLRFLRNTVMNPFQSSNGYVEVIGRIFRNTVLNCIGKIRYQPCLHEFVGCHLSKEGLIFCCSLPSYTSSGRQYHTILKFRMVDKLMQARLRQMHKTGKWRCLLLRTSVAMRMHDIVRSNDKLEFDVIVMEEQEELAKKKPFVRNSAFYVDDVIKYDHLPPETEDLEYPVFQSYFLFGNRCEAYISHCMTKKPDFFQLIRLDHLPHSLHNDVLDQGVEITMIGVHGSPLMYDGSIQDPLQAERYSVKLHGPDNVEIRTEIRLHKAEAKIWFQEVD